MKPIAYGAGLPDTPSSSGKSGVPTTTTPGSGLTPQEQLFVELYRETGDAMASCVRAKLFSPDYPTDVLARKMLERPDIQAAIAALDEAERAAAEARQLPAVRQPVEVTRDVIMADLQDVFEVAKAEKALGAAIAAKKIQASMIGALKQTVDVNFHMKRAEDMTDDELDRIIRQAKAKDAEFEEVKEGGGE